MRVFLGRMAVVLCVCFLLTGNTHFCMADELTDIEAFFAAEETVSGMVDVPGNGLTRYYAQNDGLWGRLIYEAPGVESNRTFKDSACCPTSVAMAVAALIPEEELSVISRYARTPYAFCSCSVNSSHCGSRHPRYILTTQKDFARFLPLVIADVATGNNIWRNQGRTSNVGTATGFIKAVAQAYGLEYEINESFDAAKEAIRREDQAVVALAGHGGCFTDTGHYIYLASVDDEKLYILDPLCRTQYRTNRGDRVHIIQPGLVYLELKDLRYAFFSNFIIFTKAE